MIRWLKRRRWLRRFWETQTLKPPINSYGLGVVKKSCHAMINMETYYYATHFHR